MVDLGFQISPARRPVVYVLVGAWILLCSTTQSLFGINIRLVFPDGRPVVDATVSILGYSGSTRTDRRGQFTWKPDPSAPFEVLVVLASGKYAAPVLIQALPESGLLELTLEPVVTENVTVTAGATPHTEASPASGMTLVGQRDLFQRQPSQLMDSLDNIPGVSRVSEGYAAVPSIRGLARGRTLILIDGGRVTSERRAGASASFLDPFSLEGVEIARGPGSVAYGSDAFGGVIHARTRLPDPNDPFKIRFLGSLAAGAPEQSARIQFSSGFREGGILLQGRLRNFDNYDSPLGEVGNTSSKDHGFLAKFADEVGAGRLLMGWQSDGGRDVGRPRTSLSNRIRYPREDSHRFTAEYQLDPVQGFSRIGFSGFLGSYRLVTDRDNLPSLEQTRVIQRADVFARDFGFRFQAVRPLRQARFEFGLDLNGRFDLQAKDIREEFDSDDRLVKTFQEESIQNAQRNDVALYWTGETLITRRLTASAGTRLDFVGTDNSGGLTGDSSTSNTALSGFASLRIEPKSGFSVTSQVTRGFRDPTLSARYFRGVSGRGFVTGNPELDSETSLQFDLAVRYTRPQQRFSIYFYRYRINDLIERFEEDDDLFFFRNRGQARLRGVEVELQTELTSAWTLELGAQLARGKALDHDSSLDDVPIQSLTVVLRRALGERGYLQLRGALYDRDERPGPTERIVHGYGRLDFGAGWNFEQGLGLRFQVRNLFDKDYPASPDSSSVLAAGRSALLSLSVEL